MSLKGHFLIPVNSIKFKTGKEALIAWENGDTFKIPLTDYHCTIRDCRIGDLIGIVYQYPNFAHIVRYEHTQDKVRKLITKHLNSFGIKANKKNKPI